MMRAILDHPFPNGRPDEWAVEWGQDKYGVFESFEIEGLVQRMRWIEPGRFWMGSPKDEEGHDRRELRHEVELSQGYWIADTPCTQAVWRAVMGENPSYFKGDELRPVEFVSWEDCQRFLQKLGEKIDGREPPSPMDRSGGMAFRLPTEAEWERACRGGTDWAKPLWDPDRKGESKVLKRIGWYGGNSGKETHPVAQLLPNPFGLYDMLGNVWEWCSDGYSNYPPGLVVDPYVPVGGGNRVIRGGSWATYSRYCRAASRDVRDPDYADDDVGFRLVRGRAPRKRRSLKKKWAEPQEGTRSGPDKRDAGRGPFEA